MKKDSYPRFANSPLPALVLPSPRPSILPKRRKIRFSLIWLGGFILTNAVLAQVSATAKGERTTTVSEPVHMDVFRAGEDGYHSYRIPSVIVTTKGTLLAFCEGRKERRTTFLIQSNTNPEPGVTS